MTSRHHPMSPGGDTTNVWGAVVSDPSGQALSSKYGPQARFPRKTLLGRDRWPKATTTPERDRSLRISSRHLPRAGIHHDAREREASRCRAVGHVPLRLDELAAFIRWYEDHAKPKCLNDFWRWCKSTVENLVDGCSIYPGYFSECHLTACPPNFGTEQLNHLFRLKWSQASAWLADGGPPILSLDNNPEHERWSLAMKNAAHQCKAMDFQQPTGRAPKNRPRGGRGLKVSQSCVVGWPPPTHRRLAWRPVVRQCLLGGLEARPGVRRGERQVAAARK
jgi:hypothetical protein